MDRKLINEYGTDILCYRLRTARQKTRMQYEDFDKHLRKLHKEERKLMQIEKNLGWEPLTPPFQRGWHRSFVLREDIAKSKDAAFFENILKKINTTEWSYRRNFFVKRRKWGRKYYEPKHQALRYFYAWDFERQNFNEKERQYFDLIYIYHTENKPIAKYVFNEPWRFVLRVRPYIVDKVRVKDTELEARMAEIDDYINWNGYDGRRCKVVYGKVRHWHGGGYEERVRERNPLRNKPLTRILDELYHPGTIHT